MYSQTKSYVSIAIGLLPDEGKLKITDIIADYFPEKYMRVVKMLKLSADGKYRFKRNPER